MDHIDALIRKLDDPDADVEAIKDELLALCRGSEGHEARSCLEKAARAEVLAIQWELEEVIEATAPKKVAPPEPPKPAEPPPEEEEPERPLSAADLEVVYDDPRGLILHRTKDGKRWFATQMDPSTGQPQTFELHSHEISQLKIQLSGSPYWVLGAG